MSSSIQDRITLPRRTFGVDESALDDTEGPTDGNIVQRLLRRISQRASQSRPSFVPRWPNILNSGDEGETPPSERPPIPTMMQPSGEAYSTPLPVLSMVVLSIVRLQATADK